MFFPTIVLGTVNGILSPVSKATASLVDSQLFDLELYHKQKLELEREAMLRNPETAYLVSNEEFDKMIDELGWGPKGLITMASMHIERASYNMKKASKEWFAGLLEVLFEAASLVIDTIRTFFLVVLSILGPISFAVAVYDGFQSTLTTWLSRYIVVYLWLPVSDLFSAIISKIQILMIQQDIAMLQDPNFIPDGSNSVYVIFMIIGIIGYFTVPTVAGWIVQAGGAGSYSRNINQAGMKTGNVAAAGAGAVTGNVVGKLRGRGKSIEQI